MKHPLIIKCPFIRCIDALDVYVVHSAVGNVSRVLHCAYDHSVILIDEEGKHIYRRYSARIINCYTFLFLVTGQTKSSVYTCFVCSDDISCGYYQDQYTEYPQTTQCDEGCMVSTVTLKSHD